MQSFSLPLHQRKYRGQVQISQQHTIRTTVSLKNEPGGVDLLQRDQQLSGSGRFEYISAINNTNLQASFLSRHLTGAFDEVKNKTII